MDMSCPSHSAQPLGAKLPVKILISARNGFDIITYPPRLVLTRENPLQRDDEIQHQVRRHVLVRLASTRWQYTGWIHRGVWSWTEGVSPDRCPQVPRDASQVGRVRIPHGHMVMRRH